MFRWILLFTMLNSINFCFSQNYHSVLNSSTEWNTTNSARTVYWFNTLSYTSNDTIINNIKYKILVRSQNNTAEYEPTKYYLREDNSKKVFLNKGKVEYLIYDFNAMIGDTIWQEDSLTNYLDVYYYVSNIDFVEIDGEQRKQFHIKSNWVSNSGNKEWKWIEGIGDTKFGILGFNAPDIGYNYTLCNVTLKEKPIFPEEGKECSTNYNGYTIERNKVKFYPNPATTFVSLLSLEEELEFKVYDVRGKLRLIKPQGEKKLDISSLEKGVYYSTIIMFGPNLQLRFVKL